jgi:hypothetical protein
VVLDGQPFATYGKAWNNSKMIYQINAPAGAIEIGRW